MFVGQILPMTTNGRISNDKDGIKKNKSAETKTRLILYYREKTHY